ncbi:MAG: hypothetical protein RBS91_08690 [Sulfurimonadaceae bacterium]|nr:hypothetical protein [Sulfurimonadaceae bacterium]
MKNYIQKRISLFKEREIKGEILSNIGLGIFVNALFSITISQISILIILDILFGIILIVEGTILKKEMKCKKQ